MALSSPGTGGGLSFPPGIGSTADTNTAGWTLKYSITSSEWGTTGAKANTETQSINSVTWTRTNKGTVAGGIDIVSDGVELTPGANDRWGSSPNQDCAMWHAAIADMVSGYDGTTDIIVLVTVAYPNGNPGTNTEGFALNICAADFDDGGEVGHRYNSANLAVGPARWDGATRTATTNSASPSAVLAIRRYGLHGFRTGRGSSMSIDGITWDGGFVATPLEAGGTDVYNASTDVVALCAFLGAASAGFSAKVTAVHVYELVES